MSTGTRDPWDEDAVPETAWPYPETPNQYGFEGTIARFDAFAAGARRFTGVRGVAVRAVAALLLLGLLSGVAALGGQALHLLG